MIGASFKWLIAAIVFAFPAAAALADSERMPIPLVFSSPSGSHYLRLEPSPDFDEAKARGYVYAVSGDADRLEYETSGWYSFTVLVSNDGKHIARLGPWPRYDSPPESTPAVVFYEEGSPIRTYFAADLIEDLQNLQFSVSHYSWGGSLQWSDEPWRYVVQVTTIEDRVIRFDLRTGEIVD